LFPVHPKTLADYRKALHPSGAKDDPTDGDLLEEFLELHGHRFRMWQPDTEATRWATPAAPRPYLNPTAAKTVLLKENAALRKIKTIPQLQ
jgi:hypothetical protein